MKPNINGITLIKIKTYMIKPDVIDLSQSIGRLAQVSQSLFKMSIKSSRVLGKIIFFLACNE